MSSSADWLADLFFGQVAEDRERMDRDPGTPAYPWLPDGTPTPKIDGYSPPISFVAAALGPRYPNLINLDQLRRSVLAALDGKPDTRTPQQRSRDDWAAYQAAKARYEGSKATQEEDGAAAPQEQAPRPAEEGAAPGAQDPDGPGGSAGS